jgi:AbrB family looped-hinge helix DNA binding protein
MKERLSVVTRKGQITIPAEIRRALRIKEGDKVAFTMEAGEVKLSRTGSVVAATAGALKSDMPPLTPEEERKAAEQAIAEDVVTRMNNR